jgi:predicted HicB family RNase H-like nuclease
MGRPKKENKEPDQKINIRIPVSLHERLVKFAEQEKRSMNQQLIVFIEQGIQEKEK